ncbi:hypothetical protein NQ317_011933 [Molorchus minor]|uniref:Uncharacterized protein n=1 Tax=Molorchus minor TaxID=1323400 RepID=A0ABQ9IUT3_9CUCU|nr:hypothetical protein NQ317_011933 [Molorchus minor]
MDGHHEMPYDSKLLGSPETKVEKLSFYNHTECECKEKSNYTLSDGMENGSGPSFKSADSFNPPQNSRRCQCPKHFQSVLSVSRCTCNCDEGHADCIQLKKGKEHLSITDRICIAKNECTTPVCEYGVYSSKRRQMSKQEAKNR